MASKSPLCTTAAWLPLVACLLLNINAQQHKKKPSVIVPCEGGILNSKVIFESKPVYPRAASMARAEGNVVVRVRVDEGGEIYEATACSGHPSLRQPSVEAAYRTRLSPTMLSGKTVKVAGVLIYVFKLEERTGKLYRP